MEYEPNPVVVEAEETLLLRESQRIMIPPMVTNVVEFDPNQNPLTPYYSFFIKLNIILQPVSTR